MSSSRARSIDLKQLLASAHLPALPHSAIKIMEMSRDPENGPAEFAIPIAADPGLTGQILRFVNSSYFGFSNEVSNVKLAITLVGIRTIKNFALWSAVFSLMPNPRCGPFDLKLLWQDSLRRGLFARRMAELLGSNDTEEAFAAALLQDMAVPLLAKELPADYVAVLKQRADGVYRLSEMEQDRFGWNHAEAGRIMARAWRLPESFAELVANHVVDPLPQGGTPFSANQAAVNLSARLPALSDVTWREWGPFEHLFGQLPLTEAPSVAELLAHTDEEFAEFAPILKLQAATRPLADFHREVTEDALDGAALEAIFAADSLGHSPSRKVVPTATRNASPRPRRDISHRSDRDGHGKDRSARFFALGFRSTDLPCRIRVRVRLKRRHRVSHL